MSRAVIFIICIYQKFISPFLGAHCRFYPTCSEYAKEVYLEWGFFKGSVLTLKRLLKCGIWHPGGYDPPPKNFMR